MERPAGALSVDVVASRWLVENESLTVGRTGELKLGVALDDAGISKLALTVTPRAVGWDLSLLNRNGQILYQWAKAREQIHGMAERLVCWPRIAVLVNGIETGTEHWVLLETDVYSCGALPTFVDVNGTMPTVTRARPLALTAVQQETVETIFHEYLTWPPRTAPATRSIAAARTRLGVGSESAIQERLKPVRARAEALGLRSQVGLTEPDYLFVLADHGYFEPPPMKADG